MSQNEAIYNHLKQGNSLTAIEALNKFNCFRLSGRIFDIKRIWKVKIDAKLIPVGENKTVAEYKLIGV